MKLLRSHGRADTKDYFSTNEYLDYIDLGYNFRMSNITAALGLAQLDKIKIVIDMRRKNSEYLTKKLNEKIPVIQTPVAPEGYYHLYQMYTIYVPEMRDELMNHLAKDGIMAKVYFPPVHLSHFYQNVLKCRPSLPNTEKIADHVLTLPMYPQLTMKEIDLMVNSIHSFYGGQSS
jgi:perosamine synthetase